jgi:hypothetical protein
MPDEIHVFFSFNSKDREVVGQIRHELEQRGVRVWMDQAELTPGQNWLETLGQIIPTAESMAVMVGSSGPGTWQRQEVNLGFFQFVEQQRPLIPVLLPGAANMKGFSPFLTQFHRVDFSRGIDHAGLDDLIAGISGQRPPLVDEGVLKEGLAAYLTLQKVRILGSQLSPKNPFRAHKGLAELLDFVSASSPPEVREEALTQLKFALTEDVGGAPVSESVRGLRKAFVEAIKTLAVKDLGDYFRDGSLCSLDLVRLDLRGKRLRSVRFDRAFLLETDFSGADLAEASFVGCYIRNVNFADANLEGVDFSHADWFNARGLTKEQLRCARRETLLPCPGGRTGCKQYLARNYVYKFNDYEERIQKQLTATWAVYQKPGGLCEAVSSWSHGATNGAP